MFKALGEPWQGLRDKAKVERQQFDCQACGACCCNTERNLTPSTPSREYVEVEKRDELFKRKDLLKQWAVPNDNGAFHLRLVGERQRCAALDGDIGEGVGCEIYALRPSGCRLVEAGDEECLRARAFHGLPLLTP